MVDGLSCLWIGRQKFRDLVWGAESSDMQECVVLNSILPIESFHRYNNFWLWNSRFSGHFWPWLDSCILAGLPGS
jgi:hypothetical protein